MFKRLMAFGFAMVADMSQAAPGQFDLGTQRHGGDHRSQAGVSRRRMGGREGRKLLQGRALPAIRQCGMLQCSKRPQQRVAMLAGLAVTRGVRGLFLQRQHPVERQRRA